MKIKEPGYPGDNRERDAPGGGETRVGMGGVSSLSSDTVMVKVRGEEGESVRIPSILMLMTGGLLSAKEEGKG